MTTSEDDEPFSIYAPQAGAFRKVPVSAKELRINMLHPDKASDMDSLGRRLTKLRALALMQGEAGDLDFLRSFCSLRRLTCLLPSLQNLEGLANCTRLAGLSLGATLSARPSLRVIQRLSSL